jgi:hypothetical protein
VHDVTRRARARRKNLFAKSKIERSKKNKKAKNLSEKVEADLEPIALNKTRSSSSQSATKLQSSRFTFRCFPMHSHTDAQLGLLHLNSAPNKATTSIIHLAESHDGRRDLRGNIEPSENGIRHGGGDWEPEGRSPEGQVGVDSARDAIC